MIKLKYKGLTTEFVSKILKEGIDSEFVSQVDREFTTSEYKSTIQKGLSPVKGFGRFPGYSESYKTQVLRDGTKAVRPINLELTGEMLNDLSTQKVSSKSITVGISPNASSFVKTKAKAHNLGVPEKNIPVRRFIPQRGEELIVTLQRKLRDIFAKHLAKLIKTK